MFLPADEKRDAKRSPASPFGKKDSFFLSSEFDVSGAINWYAGTNTSSRSFSIAPGFDWFFADHASFGGAIFYDASALDGQQPDGETRHSSGHSFGLEPRIGYDFELGSSFSFYSRASLAIGASGTHQSSDTVAYHHTTSSVTLGLQPFLFLHVGEHFLIGAGPSLRYDLVHQFNYVTTTHSNRNLQLELSSLVGGWL